MTRHIETPDKATAERLIAYVDSILGLPRGGTITWSVPVQHPTDPGRWSVDMPTRPIPWLTTYDRNGDAITKSIADLLAGRTVDSRTLSRDDFAERTRAWSDTVES